MSRNLAEQLSRLGELWGAHVLISALALGLGILISLPTAVLVVRRPRWRSVVLAGASVIQTVPGLALLALMVPLLGAFGLLPAVVALVLYSALPVLRNTITGIRGVDDAVIEAARAVGMTERQRLLRVELPLASPVIVAGIRTSAVWVVGMATLSTPVGQASLGNYIFGGLQTRNWTAVWVGCVAAAVLALSIDLLLALLEVATRQRSRGKLLAAVLSLVAIVGAGVMLQMSGRSASASAAETRASVTGSSRDTIPAAEPALDRALVIGTKGFTEQYVLAELLQRRLTSSGLAVKRADSLGSTVAFDALCNGDLDLYVDYTGTIWANYMKRQESSVPWLVRTSTAAWLGAEWGIRQLGSLGFENAYALAMREDAARRLSISTIDDLAQHANSLVLGSDLEFFQRPEWTRLRDTYGLRFAQRRTLSPSFMYEAVRREEVDVITAFSSDGRIALFELRVLGDPRQAFPPYDAVLLLGPTVASSSRVVAALSPLIGAIPVDKMRQANLMVDGADDKRTPAQAAAWLDEQISSPAE